MAEDLTGSYGLIVEATIFDRYPQFAVQIARCLHLWAEIDYALADLVFSGSKAPPM